ncbi:MAG TPA: phosphoglucosamine mutase [Planctomycetota bacterium]|nr:phosphoglucosamine mutase [Planctomycetota bacterium]
MALFGTDGVRARAGEGPLTSESLRRLGHAIGTLLRDKPRIFHPDVSPTVRRTLRLPEKVSGVKVVIGRDTRQSGPGIERDLLHGMGVEAIRVGVVPTPGIAWLARHWKAALGIVISASHNPPHDNGVKVISGEGFKIPDTAESSIEQVWKTAPADKRPGKSKKGSGAPYLKFLRSQLPKGRPLKDYRLVIDCAHGAASPWAPRLFRSLGARVTVLHAKPTGRNINEDAGALHPDRLAEAVRKAKADLGAAFDGDADRCILVDEKGEVRDGDHIMALCAEAMKRDGSIGGDVVVSTVMANLGLEKRLQAMGLRLARVKVGDKFVAEEMMRSGARLGGEQSGHIIFLDAATAGDGMLTTLRVLRVILETGRSLGDLCAGLTKAPQVLINVPVREKPDLDGVPAVRDAVAAAEGALKGDGRILLRYSGTESLCRVMVEGMNGDQVRWTAEKVADAVRGAIGQ